MTAKNAEQDLPSKTPGGRRIGLFVTCAVDLFRPQVGWASVELLERAGYVVEVPEQTCCGQVAYNSGEPDGARALAWQAIEAFRGYDYVVAPSGSCAGMLKRHYPTLFAGDDRLPEVTGFATRVYELTSFLVEVAGQQPVVATPTDSPTPLTYHDSCAGLRELSVRSQPRQLLAGIGNCRLVEMTDTDVCCGFGGTFCVKYPEIASRMASDKLVNAAETGARLLVGGDLSCLLHLAGTASRLADSGTGAELEFRHVAEVLAGHTDTPPIGAARKPR